MVSWLHSLFPLEWAGCNIHTEGCNRTFPQGSFLLKMSLWCFFKKLKTHPFHYLCKNYRSPCLLTLSLSRKMTRYTIGCHIMCCEWRICYLTYILKLQQLLGERIIYSVRENNNYSCKLALKVVNRVPPPPKYPLNHLKQLFRFYYMARFKFYYTEKPLKKAFGIIRLEKS